MAKRNLDIAEAIRRMDQAGELSAEAEALAAAEDPIKAIHILSEAMENWEESGVSDLIKDNPKYVRFVQDMSRQLTAEMYTVMKYTISLLYQKLQTSETYIQPKELSSILNELSKQIAIMQKVEESNPAMNETDVDKQIKQIEEELDKFNERNRNSG
jgi:hypothetical protein